MIRTFVTLMLMCPQPVVPAQPQGVLHWQPDRILANGLAAVLKHPIEEQWRDELSRSYAKLGYSQLAALFEASVTFMRGSNDSGGKGAQGVPWLCPETAGEREALEATVRRIAREYSVKGSEAAMGTARRLIQQNGFSCPLGIVWGALVLQTAPVADGSVTAEDQELALRLLVTGVDQANVFVWPVDSPAKGYEAVAHYFLARGDRISAYSALWIARLRLSSEQNTGTDGAHAELRERIDQLLGTLEPAVRRSKPKS